MTDSFSFIPHALPTVVEQARAPQSGKNRLNLTYSLEVTANGSATGNRVDMSTDLRGPGDITGLDRSLISRVEPQQGLRGFEPNYFPLIEFRDADLPWRYSLSRQGQTKRTPWLVLVTLQADEFSFVDSESGPLARILVNSAASSLPELSQAWAYAHLQVDGDGSASNILSEDSPSHISRIMAPRKLEPQRSYYAFLVPTYEAGRLAGIGRKSDDVSPFDKFAWTETDQQIDLPVYFQWHFTTDDMEDIELLLRRLKALDQSALDAALPDKKASAANPGYYPNYAINPNDAKASFDIQAAMKLPGKPIQPCQTDPALAALMTETLEEVIKGETDVSLTDEDPLVAFQPHGFRYKPEKEVSLSDAKQNQWFDRINLDLKFRHAAGLGARIVRKNQEVFSHIAWTQYEEISEANERLARLEMAKKVAEGLVKRHYKTLPSDIALSLAQPLQDFVKVSKTETVTDVLVAKGVPLSYPARVLRHQAAKRPVAKKQNNDQHLKSLAMPAFPGDTKSSAPKLNRPLEARRGGATTNPGNISNMQLTARTQLNNLFVDQSFSLEAAVKVPLADVQPYSSAALVNPIAETLTKLPEFKGRLSIQGLRPSETEVIKPVWRAPVIPKPMVNYLKEIKKDALLCGSDKLPPNTVSVFEENRLFVEALLVGMNHEMNMELRWREFPTDLRGTIFKRFWDRRLPVGDTAGDDIGAIHKWTKKLGKNVPPGFDNSDPNLIIVIKGDVVRKLGDPILAINFAEEAGKFKANKGENVEPSFVGKLGPDTAYFGFEIAQSRVKNNPKAFFVIYEPVGRLRFGLDVGSAKTRRARLQPNRQAHGFTLKGLDNRVYRPAPQAPMLQKVINIPAVPSKWDDLSWTHMRLHGSKYIDFAKTITASSETDQHWNAQKTSASLARSFWQKPIAAVLPIARVI